MEKYKILRYKPNDRPTNIARNLTLEETKAHCNDPSTHKYDKNGDIVFFDGFTRED